MNIFCFDFVIHAEVIMKEKCDGGDVLRGRTDDGDTGKLQQ